MCCQVKEVGGVKYRLVKDHAMKPDSTCKDDCVYQKMGPMGGFYCFRYGDLSSKCLEKEQELVVLITGGGESRTQFSAEIFSPNNPDKPCILPDLPYDYVLHTQDGGMLCGGLRNQILTTTCRQWNSTEGRFLEEPVHKFEHGRHGHVSWTPVSKEKTYLMGGSKKGAFIVGLHNPNTSTVVTKGKYNGAEGFNLKYSIFGACSIPNPETDTVIITGGGGDGHIDSVVDEDNRYITSLYNENGFIENFGNLIHPRKFHGCTSYVADKRRVNNIYQT